jgi:16S rRNA (cytosine967-C5)-methyltransferase
VISPARLAAYQVLLSLLHGRGELASLLAAIRPSIGDRRDYALAAEIALGVQRHRNAIDFLIDQVSSRPVARFDLEVLTILRLSLYQLLHLTRVPASAVVDDAVEMTRRVGKSSAAALTNAVLRSFSRRRHALQLPPRPPDATDRDAALAYLSVTLSHPRWLAARWLDRLGLAGAESWMTFNNEPAPVTLRANQRVGDRETLRASLARREISTRPGTWAPDALIVTAGDVLADGGDDGAFVVQDEASQLVTLLAGADPGALVLDTCASPGGKATALAAAAPTSTVVACDVRTRRMALLRRTVAVTGVANVKLLQADLLEPLPFGRIFDAVIVDAPCSGLGTLRRDPDIRWRRDETELPRFAETQRTMLAHAAAAVASGGRLVYATCSSEPEENEDIARAFLERASDFRPVDARLVHPALPASVVDERGHLRTRPDRHGLEMFFGAVFERRTDTA